MIRFWFKTCPRCKQGRLFIEKRKNDGQLFLHCEECELGWRVPSEVGAMDKSFLAIGTDSEYASKEDIETADWGGVAKEVATD